MEQRRSKWAERGWTDYVHVDVAPSDPLSLNGLALNGTSEEEEEPSAVRLPERVWGTHAESEV